MVGVGGADAGDAGEEELAAAAEAVEGVGGDGADADPDVAGHEFPVDEYVLSGVVHADLDQVLVGVVVVDGEVLHDLLSQLADEVRPGQGAVVAQGAEEADVLLFQAACQQLLDHQLRRDLGWGAPAQVVKDDDGLVARRGHFPDGGHAHRMLEPVQYLRRGQGGMAVGLHLVGRDGPILRQRQVHMGGGVRPPGVLPD